MIETGGSRGGIGSSSTSPRSKIFARAATNGASCLEAELKAQAGNALTKLKRGGDLEEAEFKKAFALDPQDATAHQWYAYDIGMIGGREQEAVAEITRAQQLDPLSPVVGFDLGLIYVLARQYDEAIVVCKKLATDNPTFALAHNCLAYAYWGKRVYAGS